MVTMSSSIGTSEQRRDPSYTPLMSKVNPLGIQHVLVLFVSIVTPAIIIAGVAVFGFGSNSRYFSFALQETLDVGDTTINEAMKLAVFKAISKIARKGCSNTVQEVYQEAAPSYGAEYLIPIAFDSRLITKIGPSVIKAEMDSGEAARSITYFDEYKYQLTLI